ncbi:hypothetical protein CDD80_3852 [Ophiocordyceps camponoti-rufipedis]|uniref:Uncharacterized protein n=1 Tax=Ophiocordyceps camponoti-rufipedis TaxID=2004952 RepID=A0A2C5Z0K3_9HYPO|nr:hypothetical protein CDD80_3852 [Ophiocordyceps camponoti-rufipedis]
MGPALSDDVAELIRNCTLCAARHDFRSSILAVVVYQSGDELDLGSPTPSSIEAATAEHDSPSNLPCVLSATNRLLSCSVSSRPRLGPFLSTGLGLDDDESPSTGTWAPGDTGRDTALLYIPPHHPPPPSRGWGWRLSRSLYGAHVPVHVTLRAPNYCVDAQASA